MKCFKDTKTWIASFLPILAWNSALVPPNRWKYHWAHPWSRCLSQQANQKRLEVCKAFLPKGQHKVRTCTCRIFTFYIISWRLGVLPYFTVIQLWNYEIPFLLDTRIPGSISMLTWPLWQPCSLPIISMCLTSFMSCCTSHWKKQVNIHRAIST